VLKAQIFLRLQQLVEDSATSRWRYSSALFEFAGILPRQKAIPGFESKLVQDPVF